MSEPFDFRIDIDESQINPKEVPFWLTVASVILFLAWGTFVVLFFSRISAIFFTFVIDKYLRLSKNGIHFRIGGISISGLHAGKIMFRNVIYDNGDMTMKVSDGHVLFKYWRSVEHRHLNLSTKRASRLHLVLHGLHVNIYNNLTKYTEIARIRRFDWFFENTNMNDAKRPQNKPPDTSPPSSVWENMWNLLGVVHVEVSAGCVLVGNKYLPYALWTRFENLNSKTSVSESANDRALLTFDGETENVAISLVKNEQFQFTAKDKEPPRTTGNDGCPILRSASLEFTYKQDLLGYVTDDEPQSITSKLPLWSSEWRFGNNTVLSYGPWTEQQRFLIYSFFYPPDYQNVSPTVMPTRGQKRIHIKHDVKVILTKETCMDIWFMRGEQLESIRTRCGAQSSLDMSILWITTDKGFYWNMNAEFLNFEATTSLVFTKLLTCQKFNVNGSFVYPLTWNGEQSWTLDYTFTKAVAWFVWDHKRLFTDLINDWIGDEPSDISKFVPFRVHNHMRVVDSFEVILLLNESNWVDTSDMNAENVEVAIVGEKLSFDCELPFVDFLPQIQSMKYDLKGEKGVAMRAKFPPDSATEPMRAALLRLARCNSYAPPSNHGTHSLDKDTWFELWRTELVKMDFDHRYRPLVVKSNIPSDIPFSVLSDYLPPPANHPWDLEPDFLGVNILIEGSDVKFTGLLVKLLFELKNNYFGWYDSITSLDDETNKISDPVKLKASFDKTNANDMKPIEYFRTMDVDVTVRVCNIRAEMLVYSPAVDEGAEPEKVPVVFVEEVAVEVKKTKTEALIQVGVSPACAYLDPSSTGAGPGCITLSGFQFRGHAMYSSKDVAWNMGLVEYGWIMEILVGDIAGTLDFPAHAIVLHQIIESLLIFVISPDDATRVPDRMQFCQHGQLITACSIAGKKTNELLGPCQTEEEMKYRQIRVSVDSVNLTFVEEKTILQVVADPVRVTVCNAHEGRFTEHVCVRVPGISIRQAVRIREKPEVVWIEGANAAIEGISLDIELPVSKKASPTIGKDRLHFAKLHDADTKRLHFLWEDHSVWGCACFGNTCFFGDTDEIGLSFMETMKKKKFFVPGIERNAEKQPQVLQSVILKNKSMLSEQEHMFYKRPNRRDTTINIRKQSTDDTESFHSAKSQQAPGLRILQSIDMTSSYAKFVDNVKVEMPSSVTVPKFGEPGAILEWCQAHPATKITHDVATKGVNELRFPTKTQKSNNAFSVVDKKEPVEQEVEYGTTREVVGKRRLAISGVAATSFDVFVTPIGIEGIERFITAASHTIPAINPCILVHICYRECVLRKHRQPLTESLFVDDENDSDHLSEVDITVDLPRVTIGLFQCGVKKNVFKTNSTDHITANMGLFLIDRAFIQSKLPRDTIGNAFSADNSNLASTLYQLKGSAITVQLLQLTNRDAPDFGSSGTSSTPNNWDQCAISRRMSNLEPRVMLDFNISDTSIILERRPVIVLVPGKSTTTNTPINSPASAPTPTPTPVNKTSMLMLTPAVGAETIPVKRKQRIHCEHYLKAEIGSVTTSLVMARPQELTAGDEFPIYEALAPVMVSWLSVLDNFQRTVDKTIHIYECWKNVAMVKIVRLAYDAPEKKVDVKIGKNRMETTRVLAAHQSSCPSCLLLKTLFRWFAYAEKAPDAIKHRLEIRPEFEVEETRKIALMSVLSHWQLCVSKQLKLASLEDAHKFKVARSETALSALVRSERRRGKKISVKKIPNKRETRVVMETKTEQPKAILGKMSPAPFINKFRKQAGDEENSIKYLDDLEMQELGTGVKSYEEDDDEDNLQFDDDFDVEPKIDHKVDLYTWMRNAQRESTLRRRKLAGGNEAIPVDLNASGDVNNMDIQQKAYYYNIYRWAQLQWTSLDSIDRDYWHLEYSIDLKEVDIRMMAKSIKSSTDHSKQFITPAQQKVMQLRGARVDGGVIWKMERDERKKIPLHGQYNVNYNATVENIRFLIGMATVSLAKELSLVFRVAMEAKNELKLNATAESTPRNEVKVFPPANTGYDLSAEWDEKVLDMIRTYEKNKQRSATTGMEKVKVMVNGKTVVSSVVLESVLNDLYVSVTISQIDLTHSKNPMPDVPVALQTSVTFSTANEEKKNATLTKKSLSSTFKLDDLTVSITKMKLTLSEADSTNKKSDILRCTLNSSFFNIHTKIRTLGSAKEANRSSNSLVANSIATTATLRLGALDGNMPMAAYSLHDVVMRHGKELEQQLNRLAAQPASTPLSNSTPFPIVDQPLLTKVTDPKHIASAEPSVGNLKELKPFATTPVSPAVAYSTGMKINGHMARKVPVAEITFSIELTSIEMNIQLLPSLQAKYRINRATSNGITGVQANWSILLDEHFFEFCVTGQGGKTETFRLLLPSVRSDGIYQAEQGNSSHKPSTDKKLIYREGGSLQMSVVLGSVNHTFTTELLNQLMFAEHSFRTELTALINRIRSSSYVSSSTRSPMSSQSSNDRANSTANLKLLLPAQNLAPVHVEKSPLLFSIKIRTKNASNREKEKNEKKEKERKEKDPKTPKSGNLGGTDQSSSSVLEKSTPWLQLTAATPTQTAVRLTIDSLEGELTNKWVVKEEGSKERIYGNAVIHFNAKLGQKIDGSSTSDLQEFATFMTQVRVENKERNMFNSSYSYHVSLNRPIFLVKAAAIDKAILLWLNYKNTYDYWRNEREKVVQEKTTKKLSNATMFSPTQIAEDADMNLSLAINNGMYMCMPLYSHDVTEGMPALVLSLQKSNLSVLVKKELTCKASFNGFKCSFIDDFDEQALTQSFLDAAHSDQSNCIFFPEGTYQLCSKAEASNGPAKWVLSVFAEMQGVEIDLDTRIGKLAKLLVNTFSMIGKDDDDDMSLWGDQRELDSDEEKVEGASELKKLKAGEKVPWMENKMHEHSRAVFELASRGVSTKLIEAEKHKLRQYELIRFKAFRRNMVEKFRRGTNASRQHTETPPPPNRAGSNSRRNSSAKPTVLTTLKEDATQEITPSDSETVNFNLDVKVNIESGTCTVRTGRKEGSMQLGLPGIREPLKRLNLGAKDIKAMFEPQIITTTTFSIPSVEIKAYHVSDPSSRTANQFSHGGNEKISKPSARDADKLHRDLNNKSRFGNTHISGEKPPALSSKRGCFYIFVGLASMPNETVVTPHLATYLEQVLEPLPPSAVFQSQNNTREASVVDDGKGEASNEVHNIVAMDTAAFPIDFVFYLDVQSSSIRFDGKQPTSRSQTQADCVLTLPRLTLELTSKRTKDNIDNYVGGIHISGQFKGFMLKIFNPLEPELDTSRALQLSLDLLSFVISRNKNSSTEPDNRVRFVFSSQISKASFEYNFRRLGELIQFPKPWYRAAIARRVFFGDQAAPRPRDDASDITGTTRSRFPTDPRSLHPPASTASTGSGSNIPHQKKPWTALVLAAIQWNEFEVTAHMSNTMGKTTWKATKGLLWGDAKLNSLNERDVSISFVLGSSELCARDGAISGIVKLNNLKISADHSLSADVKRKPRNKAKIRLDWITANIEWMSRRVLIAKWSGPCVRVEDYYKGVQENDQMVLCNLGMEVKSAWDDLQVVITKTTVDDIAAIVNRLISFFDEQLKNSRILLGNFNATTNSKKQPLIPAETRKPTTHFWEKVLDYMSEMQINEQLMGLMEREGAKVGGHMELKAKGISLVLMKGDMNSDTWAVFHLRDACIEFDPEARMNFLDNTAQQKIGILLKQTFCLKLGSRDGNQSENRANVCRVQTRFNNSSHLQKTDEILEFFIGDVMKTIGSGQTEKKKKNEVGPVQSPNSENENTAKSPTSMSSFGRFRSPASSKTKQSGTATNHNVMELFQFPGLEATMTSHQLNGVDDGDKYETVFQEPMEVSTTFVCDFFSEVAIETNFNAQVSFLPELLKSYIKESHNSSSSSHSTHSSPAVSSSKESITSETSKDLRTFICKEWKVEPKVRFIDRIKWTPPVVDEILKKLQIFDHRNTIPKVIQRAVLDPLDATLASSVIATLQIVDNKKTIQKFKKSRTDSIAPTPKRRDSRRSSSEEVSVQIDIPDIMAKIYNASSSSSNSKSN